MLKEGRLKTGGNEHEPLHGVFMSELQNLFKRWTVSKDWFGRDLRTELLTQVVKKTGNKIVVLKIPTANLDKNILLIRSQNKLFLNRGKAELVELAKRWKETGEILDGKFKEIFVGEKATSSKLYKQRKEAIEYIYPEEIDMSKVQKIGISELKQKPVENLKNKDIKEMSNIMTLVRPEIEMKLTFLELYKGTPEEKALRNYL
jgi:hypothetical protein